jgi:hypothetical protein
MKKVFALVVPAVLIVGGVAIWRGTEQPGAKPNATLGMQLLTAAADTTDGPALVHEAIANVRRAEKFTFTQTVGGFSGREAMKNGDLHGEVDLSAGNNDEPRLHATRSFANPDGTAVPVDQVVIGGDRYVRTPDKPKHTRAAGQVAKSRGKAAGNGSGAVDVVDPVDTMLEAIDTLGDDAIGTPSEPDAAGVRLVTVTPSEGVSIILAIDDAEHLVRELRYSRGAATTVFTLAGFGDPSINIETPTFE